MGPTLMARCRATSLPRALCAPPTCRRRSGDERKELTVDPQHRRHRNDQTQAAVFQPMRARIYRDGRSVPSGFVRPAAFTSNRLRLVVHPGRDEADLVVGDLARSRRCSRHRAGDRA